MDKRNKFSPIILLYMLMITWGVIFANYDSTSNYKETATKIEDILDLTEKNETIKNAKLVKEKVPVANGDIIITPDYTCNGKYEIDCTKCSLDQRYLYMYLDYIENASIKDYSNYEEIKYYDFDESIFERTPLSDNSNRQDDISFIVEAGKTATIDIPTGRYRCYYSFGNTFYGPDELFGYGSDYYKSDDIIVIFPNETSSTEFYITTYNPDGIPKDQFPTQE